MKNPHALVVALIAIDLLGVYGRSVAQSTAPAVPKPTGASASVPADDKPMPATVESALLQGDWDTVHNTLGAIAVDKLAPAARFAWGHACLACNDCNRALAVFISATDDQARSWRNYTDALARNHAGNAVAHYLHGDALARCGDLVAARNSFDRSLALDGNMALAWNARGVCSTLLGDLDDALDSLNKATKAEPRFSDPHVSLGVYWVLTRNADAARNEFLAAQGKQKDSALALNGLGCAEFGRGNMDLAYADFANAAELSPALAIAWANQGYVLTNVAGDAKNDKQPLSGSKPGTSLTVTSLPESSDLLTPDRVNKLASSGGIPAALHDLEARESQLNTEARALNALSQHTVDAVSAANDIVMALTAGRELLRVVDTVKAGATGGPPAALAYAYGQTVWTYTNWSVQNLVPDKARLGVGLTFSAVDPRQGSFSLNGLMKQLFVVPAIVGRDAIGDNQQNLTYRVATLNAEVQRIESQKRLLTTATASPPSFTPQIGVPPIAFTKPQSTNPIPPNVRLKPPIVSNPPLFPPDDRLPNVTHDDHLPGHPPGSTFAVLPWSYTKPVALPPVKGVLTSVEGAHIDYGDWPVITFHTLAYRPPPTKVKEQ